MKAPNRLIERSDSSRPRPRFAICTLGCKLNQNDEEEIRRDLRNAGLSEVGLADQADVADVQRAVDNGCREVVMTGTQVGSYKWPRGDQTLRLADLLACIFDRLAVERRSVTSVGPHEIDERFISILKRPRMAPYLHMALQSGSSAVLRRMKRCYNLQPIRRSVRHLRHEIPDIAITTDVIVGFTGETDKEFSETCEFVREMALSKNHVFPFSARRDTVTATVPDQVLRRVSARRSARLREIADELRSESISTQLGHKTEARREQAHNDILFGETVWGRLTRNYLRVSAPSSRDPQNCMAAAVPISAIREGAQAGAPVLVS